MDYNIVRELNSSNGSSNYSEAQGASLDLSRAIPVGIILGILMLSTATGNILVIVAVVREKHLHTLSNRLVASLAGTDMMVALTAMPLAAAHFIFGHWPFTSIMCHIYITMDVVFCTSSILHLVGIALDRYWTVTDVTYTRGSKKNKYFYPVMVTGVWLLAAAVSLPPFFLESGSEVEEGVCQISQDKVYTIYSTFAAFYIPMTVIFIIYTKIFRVVRATVRRSSIRKKYQHQVMIAPTAATNEQTETLITEVATCNGQTTPVKHQNGNTKSPTSEVTKDLYTERADESSTGDSSNSQGAGEKKCIEANLNLNPRSKVITKIIPKKAKKLTMKQNHPKEKLSRKRERKALRTLLIITGGFCTCWLPFFIFAIIQPFCPSCNIPKEVFEFVTWLGYFNSMLNPIIYTIFSPDFRAAFRKTLLGQCT